MQDMRCFLLGSYIISQLIVLWAPLGIEQEASKLKKDLRLPITLETGTLTILNANRVGRHIIFSSFKGLSDSMDRVGLNGGYGCGRGFRTQQK
jgi:hypothetical protein